MKGYLQLNVLLRCARVRNIRSIRAIIKRIAIALFNHTESTNKLITIRIRIIIKRISSILFNPLDVMFNPKL